jgi:hypothetical protein
MLLKADKPVKTIRSAISIQTDGKRSISWLVPAKRLPGDDYKVSIVSTTNSSFADASDNAFSIKQPGPIMVVAPNGGESWQVDKRYTIRWKSTVNIGTSVKIELLKGDAVVKTINSSAVVGSLGNGLLSWTVHKNLAYGNDYRIRVTSNENASYTDSSDKTFSIGGPTLDVTAPDDGESWSVGSQQTIGWIFTENPGGNVKIHLLKAGLPVRTITTGTPIGANGIGSFAWTIPEKLRTAGDYQILVRHTAISGCTGASNGSFTITKTVAPDLE